LTTAACVGACVATPGRYCPLGATSSTPLVCPAGSYSSSLGAAACSGCPAGTWGASSGTNASSCSGLCQPGTTSPPGSTICTSCPVGYFANSSGAGLCTPCPAGTYGSVLGLNTSSCTGMCTPTPGRYCPDAATSGSPLLCPEGRFSVTGSFTLCEPCVSGSYCPSGSVAPVLCPMGTFSAPRSGVCSPCLSGRYGNTTGLFNSTCGGGCEAGPGSYCPAGLVTAIGTLCPAGRYTDVGGASLCTPCPGGRVGAAQGYNSSLCGGQCPPGQSSAPGFTSCSPCPAGAFSNMSVCTACPAGTFGLVAGMSAATCSGLCVPTPGRLCTDGATVSNGHPCSPGQYSELGSNASTCTLWYACPLLCRAD
jgi:hypothetical protein